jgi:hypothetical protein
MKQISLCIAFAFVFSLYSCSSAKHYRKTSFAPGFLQDKTVIFTLTEKSANERILVSGPFIGTINTVQNNKVLFRKSIQELATETGLNLKVIDTIPATSDAVIHIDADLKLIRLDFGFSAGTTETYMRYTVKGNEKMIPITGRYKQGGGGAETSMLRNSLKNANYLLLKELEKTNLY